MIIHEQEPLPQPLLPPNRPLPQPLSLPPQQQRRSKMIIKQEQSPLPLDVKPHIGVPPNNLYTHILFRYGESVTMCLKIFLGADEI